MDNQSTQRTRDEGERQRRREMQKQGERTAAVLAALAEQNKPLRCPDWPDAKVLHPNDHVITGCGSTNVEGPAEDGTYDCRECGIWFLPELY